MRTRKKYTREFEEDAVSLVTEKGHKVAEAARNLGIDRRMLGRWIKPESVSRDERYFALS